MAKRAKYRLSRAILDADREVIEALADMPDYNPPNKSYTLTSLQEQLAVLTRSEQIENRNKRIYDASYEDTTDAGWKLHEMVQASKDQVVALYGNDANEMQMIGRKKRSDRKPPTRRNSGS